MSVVIMFVCLQELWFGKKYGNDFGSLFNPRKSIIAVISKAALNSQFSKELFVKIAIYKMYSAKIKSLLFYFFIKVKTIHKGV